MSVKDLSLMQAALMELSSPHYPLKQAYCAGYDQGELDTIARAESLMSEQSANAEDQSVGRAMGMIWEWCEAVPGRQFGGTGPTFASVSGVPGEDLQRGSVYRYHHDNSPREALAGLAAWCAEHMPRQGEEVIPAPPREKPPEPEF